MKVLILGDGLLGSQLKEDNPQWDVLSRKQGELDITTFHWMHIIKNYDVVINCIAYTNTYDTNRETHWEVNYAWVDRLIKGCNSHNVKLVHISTDYVYANSRPNASEECVPVHHESWYGYTKLLSDGLVQLKSHNYLLIRVGFKPTPFPYGEAPTTIIGNFDYVDTITHLLSLMVYKDYVGVYNIGSDLKTMYDLAFDTNKNVRGVTEIPVKGMPTDLSMDLTKLKNSKL
jgi:dTDP-4-dehydrorhamnose reductase